MNNTQLAELLQRTLNTVRNQPTHTETEIAVAWMLQGMVAMILGKPPILPQPQPQPIQQPKASPSRVPQQQQQQQQVPQAKQKPQQARDFRAWFEQQQESENKLGGNWYKRANAKK